MPNTQTSLDRRADSGPRRDTFSVPKPAWLKVKLPTQPSFFKIAELLKKDNLHTICQSARCPNVFACWSARTATFLILGDICARQCGFCAVRKGTPLPLSTAEPWQVAEAVASMGLDYAVVTSVTRDDLPDGGASVFAQTIRAIRQLRPRTKVEVLIPDFRGDETPLSTVIAAGPDVVNHNLETAESCFPSINRPKENYHRSLRVLALAREMGMLTKSGLMVGLGEAPSDLDQALADLRAAGCSLLTVGQYLQPTKDNLAVSRYYTPEEFEEIKTQALALGFRQVESSPLARSSFQAGRMYLAASSGGAADPCVT
ncbi:MAG: lipoyl synthase [Acidobacteriota bacterium]